MKQKLSSDVLAALEKAQRSPGWNNRRGDVQRFVLANAYRHASCVLYVVPFRRWAYRRSERQVQQWQREQGIKA